VFSIHHPAINAHSSEDGKDIKANPIGDDLFRFSLIFYHCLSEVRFLNSIEATAEFFSNPDYL
jgi:hypothetical protein